VLISFCLFDDPFSSTPIVEVAMPAPARIVELTDRFDYNLESYKKGQYNETQVRLEYINPLMEELGWDVTNKQGYSEAYKDVIHEDAVKVGGVTKAPDYCFRIGGTRKFFLEAKKPSVNIKEDTHPSYQLRRYAWSAKLPLSILTDFEEFAVYDCRVKPVKTDKASNARVMYLKYADYKDKWDEIAGIFSHEAILKGSFDKYVESKRKKKGTAEVDTAFLAEIERWRELLARNIALRNPNLSQREVNFSVQRTIDRIIFLRICEDRGVENYGRLMALQNGERVYKRLFQLFRQADDRYNSGLFHFRSEKDRDSDVDNLTSGLVIDDRVLKDILKHLYYPDSPYEFSVLPADILGQVYEQFLGKVIRLTPAHHAVVEDKPEVRKAGGVYYTPTYIVDYIVKQTVGKLVEGKKPGPRGAVSKLKILDPACGSGSFLLGAFQYLLDWHRDEYIKDDPKKWATGKNPRLYQSPGGDWRLTTDERKRILLNNIYGVDIDSQAVETTKLSLLLKVLEGEDAQTITQQLALFHQRALPDLANNIKCGNSLIGPDFYDGQQMSLLDEEEAYRINAFDWQTEFPEIMNNGGFDAVIGNPPYIRIQGMKEWAPLEVEFYKKRYTAASKGNYDIYVVFVEKGLNLLNGRGRFGFILPHKFFNAKYGESLRGLLAEGRHLSSIVHFGYQQVFSGATTYTCLLFLTQSGNEQFQFAKVDNITTWRTNAEATQGKLNAKNTSAFEWNFIVGKRANLFKKLNKMPVKLGDICRIFQGLVTGADKLFVLRNPGDIEPQLLRRFLKTGSISPYGFPRTSHWILFPYYLHHGTATLIPQGDLEDKFPKSWAYLKSNEKALRFREKGKWNHERWYAFGRSQNLAQMEGPKLIIQVLALKPTVIYDDLNLYMTGGGSGPFYGIRPWDKRISTLYMMGILNSRLFGVMVSAQSTQMRSGYFKFSKQYIESASVPFSGLNSSIKQAELDQMVDLVEQMLTLHKQLVEAKDPQTKTVLQRQIETINRQIDRLVYDLYELTEEEIKIVEGNEEGERP